MIKTTEKIFNQKRKIILLILTISIWAIWILFFNYPSCDNWDCFNSRLEKCSKSKFIGDSNGIVFEYTIQGKSNDYCKVNVELLQGELNNQDSIKLENQEMVCSLPLGIIVIPEKNIGNCHGLLKEGLQDLMIEKLYTYLVNNLGRINLEVLDAPILN